MSAEPLDLAAVRERLAGTRGRQYWRSLDELAETPEFRAMVQREFPPGASEWWDGLSRRSFLKLAAASLALSGLSACTKQPVHAIIPYVLPPEDVVLGKPLFYATSMMQGGFATGVLAKSREGHPIKVDGNPEHPASAGGSSAWLQASLLELYDPDRSTSVLRQGELSTWADFLADLNLLIAEQKQKQGAGLHFLTETVTSPTLVAQLKEIVRLFPRAAWHQFEPISRDNVQEGARLAFGELVETQHDFSEARTVVAFDSDFLLMHPDRLKYSKAFSANRRRAQEGREPVRFYAVESTPTVTGSMADHRLPLGLAECEECLRRLAARISSGKSGTGLGQAPLSPAGEAWLEAAAAELMAHRGGSIVIAGENLSPHSHALVHALNQTLGNVGKTLFYTESAEPSALNKLNSLRELAENLRDDKVEALFILGANPAYHAPADLDFPQLLRQGQKTVRTIHLGLEADETAVLCTWHIPQAHFLEAWGDGRSFDGTVTMQQPLIAPLYHGRTPYEILGALVQQEPLPDDYAIIRNYWRSKGLGDDFEAGWERAIHDGFIRGTAFPPRQVHLKKELSALLAEEVSGSPANGASATRADTVELDIRPDPNVWDGRFANNAWLQECPRPITKISWDNALLVSPALAERHHLVNNDVLEVTFQGRTLSGPVWITPGQPERTITLHLGYGRERTGRAGTGVGFNAGALRTTRHFWGGPDAFFKRTGKTYSLVTMQTHHDLGSPERQVHRLVKLSEFRAHSDAIKKTLEVPDHEETLYEPHQYPYQGYRWGMSINLTTCIGCSACLVACQAENNIPVVGREEVGRHREMSWIRIDTYYQGSLENPSFHHMPVPCMQCEDAPCELVCPVAATVHDHEGLNLQVYNRCVGTRFCSNNCPYKVRRFNFLFYASYKQASYEPMYNPEVTLRWRGVMEKCTYCIQRINAARISAETENRRIGPAEIQTACQQACPADAIIFGDLNQTESAVAKLKRHPLDYSMLGELNTRPRTTYLAKVINPSAALEGKEENGNTPGV